MLAKTDSWSRPLLLIVTLLALYQSVRLYSTARALQANSSDYEVQLKLIHLFELAESGPPGSLQPEYESLHAQLPLGLRSDLHDVDLSDKESFQVAKEVLERSRSATRQSIELGWTRMREHIWLATLFWIAALALAAKPKSAAGISRPAASSGHQVPLSVTHMALSAQDSDGTPTQTSVRGYTDRVLRALSNLLILAGPDGSIQMINDAVCTTLGYKRGELLGTSYEALSASELTKLPPGTRNLETNFATKSGKLVPVLVSCSAVYKEDDTVEGLVVVAQDISERKETERSLRESEQRLRGLMERLVTAQEDERRNVARDLHDGMLQLVIAAEMQLTVMRKKLDPEGEHSGLTQGTQYLSEAVKEGRRLIHNLRPPTLDKFGLVQSVRQEALKLSRELECEAVFQMDLGETELPGSLETTVFRICQEAMNNIRKYAKPQKIVIEMEIVERKLRVGIEDDGVGFDANDPAFESGVGLHSMRERAEMHGGELRHESEPGQGTKVTAILPLED